MHTKAVYRMAQGLNEAGVVTLRFNFRGVGTSTGSFDDGVGEMDDLRAALDWLEGAYPQLPLLSGGFSFGSMVGLSVGSDDDRVVGLLGAGLPVGLDDRYDYDYLTDVDKPILVVQGENDEFGSGAQVASEVARIGGHVSLVRIPETDHYFAGRLDELRAAVRGYYDSGPGSRLLVMM
jgi:uncharacterized protein